MYFLLPSVVLTGRCTFLNHDSGVQPYMIEERLLDREPPWTGAFFTWLLISNWNGIVLPPAGGYIHITEMELGWEQE